MTAAELTKRLSARYAFPEFAFFTQVYRPTRRGVRYADAMALNLWSTRGLEFHGFEIKVDRRDWLRELRDPAKAEEIATYCDRWWLVVPDQEFLKEGELPEPWGLITAAGEGLKVVKQAPKMDAVPLDRKFVSVLIRQFYNDERQRNHTDEVLQAARAAGYETGVRSVQWEATNAKHDLQQLRDAVTKFEKASGVSIAHWDAGRVGDAVRLVLSGGHLRFTERLKTLRNSVGLITADIDKALQESAEQGSESAGMMK